MKKALIQLWNLILSSLTEDHGKGSGKRLSAMFFGFLVSVVIFYCIFISELKPSKADFAIWVIGTLVGYIAVVFGLTYIPGRSEKAKEEDESK